jgi:hypothetical protein
MNQIKLSKQYPQTAGQSKFFLQWVDQCPSKEISQELKSVLMGEIPPGNRSVILCLFIGELRVPVMHVTNWGTAKLLRLRSQIGETFEIQIVGEKPKPDPAQIIIPEVLGNEPKS